MADQIRRALAKLGKPAQDHPADPKTAAARVRNLLGDAGFRERYLVGDVKARAEVRQLHAAMAGTRAPSGTSAATAQARLNDLLADPSWRARRLAGDVAAATEQAELVRAIAAEEDAG